MISRKLNAKFAILRTAMSPLPRTAVDGSAHDGVVRLEGGRNFRDLGGYATEDGRRVRRGRLFRSGAPVGLTAADRARLEALGLHRVIDLRSREERVREPAAWPLAPGAGVREFDYSMDPDDYLGLMRPDITPDELEALMCRFYRRMPYDYEAPYSALFTELLEARGAVAFHCAAGKDRTGIAAALVLSVLGVARETVIDDYLVSNRMLDPASLGRPSHMPLALFNLVARVERTWIEATFAHIDAEEGSVARFVERRLGVDGAAARRLRELYVE
jgi:protein-tyrosine phosphatase